MYKAVLHYPGSTTAIPSGSSTAWYNTADQTTNYERLRIFWSSNVATITTEAAGTGTGRSLDVKISDGSGFRINPNGRVQAMGAAGGIWAMTPQADSIGLQFNGRMLTGSGPSVSLSNDGFGNQFSASSGSQLMAQVSATRNQTGTAAFTGLDVNISGTGGSGSQRLLDLREGGTSRFYVEAGAPTSGNTVAFISYHNGASVQLQRVTLGAADSGGAGFKVLRVPN